MALRHEPFEECRCCDKAAADIDLYKREILAASATVDAGGKTFVVVPEVKAKIERLEKLVYVPGVWRCAKCDFRLIQSNLNASDGTVTARDTPGDKCPNCASPLWRVTERQERIEAMELAETGFIRAGKAEDALADLADTADAVGVRFFDTDTMEPEVEAMQKATLAAREVLEPKPRRASASAN